MSKIIFVIMIAGMIVSAGICSERNDDQEMKALNKACDSGNAESCLALGFEYNRHGNAEDGVPQSNYNLFKAPMAYAKACSFRNAEGCARAGEAYESLNNYSQAMVYYSKACDLGNQEGCRNLSSIYAQGKGVVRNNDKAADYLSRACDNGDSTICTFLGESYVGKIKRPYMGVQVGVNYSKGAELFNKGCALGYVSSCENLGIMFQKGIGVQQNSSKSRSYYAKACRLGSKEACAVVNKK